mgnify:FL=1
MREDPVQTFDFSNSAKSSPLPLVLPPNENHGRERLHRDRQQSARIRLQLYLFLGTCLTTFAAGAVGWQPVVLGLYGGLTTDLTEYWFRGLIYMLSVMTILTAHEAGHFVAAYRHRIPATLPFFLPLPVMLTGTLGAVIGMEGSRADRKQLFDIALAGPLAGLFVAIPLFVIGLVFAQPTDASIFSMPLLATWLLQVIRPELPIGQVLAPNAFLMAGWVGFLVTGLNMIPLSQLDGGHICHAIFGRSSCLVARSVLIGAITAVILTGADHWVLMIVLITCMGVDHPPIRNESKPLGTWRTILGLVSFIIPVITFMPEPLLLPGFIFIR